MVVPLLHELHQLFERIRQRDWDGALALMSDTLSWRMPGKPERFPSAGLYDKARLERLFQRMHARLETPLHMSVLDIVADGDRLAVEVESTADLTNGRRYSQQYHFKMQLRDGKILSVREYLDTQHSFDIWFASQCFPAPPTLRQHARAKVLKPTVAVGGGLSRALRGTFRSRAALIVSKQERHDATRCSFTEKGCYVGYRPVGRASG